jgi:carbamoyltransferase
MGEPIVCHPREAIRCFYDSGLDLLVLSNFVLQKDAR